MANTFKNAAATATGTSEVSVYTVPSSTTSTVIGLTCANITTTSPIKVSIRVYDNSGTAHYYIVKNAVLEASDIIKVESDTASSVDTIVSVLQQT